MGRSSRVRLGACAYMFTFLMQLINVSRQCFDGLGFLARHMVVHRDLFLRNLLARIDDGFITVKIGDFGSATRATRRDKHGYYCESAKTDDHLPPESVDYGLSYVFHSDVFTLCSSLHAFFEKCKHILSPEFCLIGGH